LFPSDDLPRRDHLRDVDSNATILANDLARKGAGSDVLEGQNPSPDIKSAYAKEYGEFFIDDISPLGIHYERYRVIP